MIGYATTIKVDALALMGEMLKQTEKNTGAKGSVVTGSKREPVKDTAPTLADLGIGKKESVAAHFFFGFFTTGFFGRPGFRFCFANASTSDRSSRWSRPIFVDFNRPPLSSAYTRFAVTRSNFADSATVNQSPRFNSTMPQL